MTNCKNCGAVVDIHAEKCAYCDTPYLFKPRSDEEENTIKLDIDGPSLLKVASLGISIDEAHEAFMQLAKIIPKDNDT